MDNAMKDDFLKELANIGLGNAATSLSQMVNSKVRISIPSIGVIPVNAAMDPETYFCAVSMGLQGDAKGALVNIFSDKTSFWIIDKVSGKTDGSTVLFDEEGKSVMSEFANIIGGAFLNSLANFSSFKILPKIPVVFLGKGEQIRDEFEQAINVEVQNALYAKAEILIDEVKIEGRIYLVLDHESFEKIFNKFQ